MRMIKIIALFLMCLFLSACSSFQLNLADLMQSPKLTEDQAEIYEALTNAAGVSDVQLKYPQAGSYRSAFVMFDLDADGEKEALVFYNMPDWEGNVRIMVLDHIDGAWTSVYDAVGEGTDILQVDFRVLTSSGDYNVLIGWEKGSAENTNISVYEYRKNQLMVLYENDYTQLLIQDIDADGIEELLLANVTNQSKSGNIRLINDVNGSLQSVSRMTLPAGIVSISGMQIGKIAPGETAVFLDVSLGSQTATEVLLYKSDGKLYDLRGEEEEIKWNFLRNVAIKSEDINGDGVIEIPVQVSGTDGDENQEDTTNNGMIQYMRLVDLQLFQRANTHPDSQAISSGFEPVWTGFVSKEYGFRIQFLDNWVGNVKVTKELERNEWVITPVDVSSTGDPPTILSIRVYDQEEVRDVFDNASYKRVAKRGGYEYFAAVGQSADIPTGMRIYDSEVTARFSLLKS